MTYHLKLIYESVQSESGTVINKTQCLKWAGTHHNGVSAIISIAKYCFFTSMLNVYTDAASLQGIILKEFPEYFSPL